MPNDKNFVPRLDGTGSLGRTDKQWNEIHAKTFYGNGSNLTGVTASADMGGTMTAHIIPDTNAVYDLGNASNKIRHLFLSDNSLWVGDSHKISIQSGKMKFKKRDGAPQVLKTALSGVNLEIDTAATQMVQNNLLNPADVPGRVSITESNITLDELHIMAANYGVDPLAMFSEVNMDNDFNDDLVELSQEASLPDSSTLQLGTMIYDTNTHNVKVVASDDDGATKIWKTLSFV